MPGEEASTGNGLGAGPTQLLGVESENPEAEPGRMKAQPLRDHNQESAGEIGTEARAGCGLERGLLPRAQERPAGMNFW